MAKWQRMWDGQDNQEVGLEAAILERKRNSSLVEQLSCAEDVAGLKPCTEAAGVRRQMIRRQRADRSGRARSRTLRCSSALMRSPWLSIAAVSTSPRSSSGGSPIRCGGRASRSAPTWRKAWAGRGFAPADFRRFVVMAVGSADEMRVWARYCLDLGYIDEAMWRLWRDEYTEISKMLQGLRKALAPSLRSLRAAFCHLPSGPVAERSVGR